MTCDSKFDLFTTDHKDISEIFFYIHSAIGYQSTFIAGNCKQYYKE